MQERSTQKALHLKAILLGRTSHGTVISEIFENFTVNLQNILVIYFANNLRDCRKTLNIYVDENRNGPSHKTA